MPGSVARGGTGAARDVRAARVRPQARSAGCGRGSRRRRGAVGAAGEGWAWTAKRREASRLRRGRPGAGVCREGGADDCEHRGPTARCGRPGGRDPAQHARLTGPGAAAGKGSGAEVLNVRELILRSDDGPRGCAAVLRELWLLRRMTSAPPPRGTKPSPARSPWLEGLCAAGCVLPHGGAPGGGVQVQQTWRETVDNKGGGKRGGKRVPHTSD